MPKDIYILGSGGFAKEVAFLIEDINRREEKWDIVGYVDKINLLGKKNGKYEVVSTEEELIAKDKEVSIAIGIGKPSLIEKITKKLNQADYFMFPNLIHPTALADWRAIKIGVGNIITANNIFTTDIQIGSFNIFNLSCTLGHDTAIGSFNVFNPSVNLSGGLKIGNKNLFGTGTQILQYIEIRNNITVGAGSVVTKHLTEEGTYVGIPARKIK